MFHRRAMILQADSHDVSLVKNIITPGLPIPSLVCKMNGNSVVTTFYPTLVDMVNKSLYGMCKFTWKKEEHPRRR